MLEKKISNIRLFDIDGVITDPLEEKVNPEILEELRRDLISEKPLVFITGRGWNWIQKKIIIPLTETISDHSLLRNIFVSAEKGGVSVTFVNNQWEEKIIVEEKLPARFLQKADALTKHFAQIMSRTEDKKTIYTVKMHTLEDTLSNSKKGEKLTEFHIERDELKRQLETLLMQYKLDTVYEIDTGTIALDVQPRSAGKKLGTKEAIDWLTKNNWQADLYEVFGDSLSDMDISVTLYEQHFPVKMIYVGNTKDVEKSIMPFAVIPQGDFDKGTLIYLTHER